MYPANKRRMKRKPMNINSQNRAWSARCHCYNYHNSSSGRCTCRNSGREAYGLGILDPTRKPGDLAVCEYCREHCPIGKGPIPEQPQSQS